MAVLGAVLGPVYSAIQTGQCAGAAGIAYLIKNYFSNEDGKVFGKIG